MSTTTGLQAFLEQLPEAERARFEALENPTEVIAFLEERLVGLYDDLRQKGEETASAQDARRIYKVAAEDADTRLKEQGQRHRDFALYLGRYLNDEIRDLDIPPEVPEELGQYGEFLLLMVRELREKAQRPLAEDTQKVVFMPGDTQLDVILEVILQSAENENPGKYFIDHLSRQFVIPEGYDSRLVRLGAFFEGYAGMKAELSHAQETLQGQRQTLAGVAADLEELEGLRGRFPRLEEQVGELQRRLAETERYWETETRDRIAADGEVRNVRTILTGKEAELRRLNTQEVELQTEIATTRGDLGAVKEYSERLKQFLRRGAQRLRESTNSLRAERRLSAGLQEKVGELTREVERGSGQYTTILQERDDARQQVVDLTTQLGERTEEYQSAHRQRRLAEARRELLQGEHQTTIQEGERLYRQIDELTAQLRVARTEIDTYSTTNAKKTVRIAELEAQKEELELDSALQAGEREQRLRTVTTERDAARGALQGQLDEVDYLEGKVTELTGRVGNYSTELERIRKKHQTATEKVGDVVRLYRATQQELEEQRLNLALTEGLLDHVAALTKNVEELGGTVRYAKQLCQIGADEIERLREEVAQGERDYGTVSNSLRERLQGETSIRKSINRHLRKRERQIVRLSRQLGSLDIDYTVLDVEREVLSDQLQNAEAERDNLREGLTAIETEVGRLTGVLQTTLQGASDYVTELAAHYEENVGGFTRENAELERRLEEAIAGLEVVNSQIEIYTRGMAGARVLTERLVATTSPPRMRMAHQPLAVEMEEPEGVPPAVTEPVLDAMILSVEPVAPSLEQPVPPIRRTRTYYPQNILRGLAQAGALAGTVVAASVATYYVHDALTSPPAVQQVTIPVQIPIQNAADLLRYKSALESAYLEGIHHREGREAILQRLQETAQRHPLQNDALQPEYESQLTHMRRIVSITHK